MCQVEEREEPGNDVFCITFGVEFYFGKYLIRVLLKQCDFEWQTPSLGFDVCAPGTVKRG